MWCIGLIVSTQSILRTDTFGLWVVTHSLANTDFHGHRQTVKMYRCLLIEINYTQCTLSSRSEHSKAPYLLTKNGPLKMYNIVTNSYTNSQHNALVVCDPLKDTCPRCRKTFLYCICLIHLCYPRRNFGRNQLLGGSISLSPLITSKMNYLHVSITRVFNQSFLWSQHSQE